jgi:hypothetical protein
MKADVKRRFWRGTLMNTAGMLLVWTVLAWALQRFSPWGWTEAWLSLVVADHIGMRAGRMTVDRIVEDSDG